VSHDPIADNVNRLADQESARRRLDLDDRERNRLQLSAAQARIAELETERDELAPLAAEAKAQREMWERVHKPAVAVLTQLERMRGERDAARAALAVAGSGRQTWMREALGRETEGDDRDAEMRRLAAEVAKLKAQRETMARWLEKMASHSPACVRSWGEDATGCTCGLSAAIAAGNEGVGP